MVSFRQTVFPEAVLKVCSVSEGKGKLDEEDKVLEEHTELEITVAVSGICVPSVHRRDTLYPLSRAQSRCPVSQQICRPAKKEPGSGSRKPGPHQPVT